MFLLHVVAGIRLRHLPLLSSVCLPSGKAGQMLASSRLLCLPVSGPAPSLDRRSASQRLFVAQHTDLGSLFPSLNPRRALCPQDEAHPLSGGQGPSLWVPCCHCCPPSPPAAATWTLGGPREDAVACGASLHPLAVLQACHSLHGRFLAPSPPPLLGQAPLLSAVTFHSFGEYGAPPQGQHPGRGVQGRSPHSRCLQGFPAWWGHTPSVTNASIWVDTEEGHWLHVGA